MSTPTGPPGNAYLTLQSWAFQRNKKGGHNERQFTVLCGDNPPTIIDGYAKWGVIDRPLRQGVTVPQGFNPAQVKCEVRFGVWDGRFKFEGWDTSDNAADHVESNIDDLHWMAGGNSLGGPSPIVYADAFSARDNGSRTKLMPWQYRGVGWVITGGINWGTALRKVGGARGGSRVYQEANFTLMGFSGLGVNPPPQQSRLQGNFFVVNHHVRTAMEIAASNSSRSPEALIATLADNICTDKRNNPCAGSRVKLERKSITWRIPFGTRVWVPAHFV